MVNSTTIQQYIQSHKQKIQIFVEKLREVHSIIKSLSSIDDVDFSKLNLNQLSIFKGLKLEDLQSYLDTINEIKNIDWKSTSFVPTADFVSFDVESAKLYAKALSDVDDKQAALLLSTQGLSNAQIQQTLAQRGLNTQQQYEAMLNTGLLKSRQKLTNVQVQSTLQSVLGSQAKAKEVMESMKLSVAIEGEEAQTVQLTQKKIALAVQTGQLTQAQAQELAMHLGVTGAMKAQNASAMPTWIANMGTMAKVTWLQVKATGAWLATNPVGWIVGASAALIGLFAGYQKLNKEVEKTREKAQELNDSFENSKSEISDYKDKINDLYETIKDSRSSVEEVTTARENLMSIQDELIAKFGDEKETIDLVTQAINGQANALDTLTQKQWQATKNEFNESGFWNNIANFFSGYDSNIERMLDEYGSYTQTINLSRITGGLKPEAYTELRKYLENELGAVWSDDTWVFDFTGNANEVHDKLIELQNLSDKIEFKGDSVQYLTKLANEAKSVSEQYKDMYNQWVLYEQVLTNDAYTEYFNNINNAYEEYQNAFVTGDKEAIDKATENFASILDETTKGIDEKSIVDYFNNMYPTLMSEVEKWEFKAKILPTFDTHALDEKTKADVLEMRQTDGIQDGEQTFNSIVRLAEKYNIIVDDNNESILQLLDLLVEWGILQGEITTSAETQSETTSSFTESQIETLETYQKNIETISNALSNLYNLESSDITSLMTEFSKYGDIFEQFGVDGTKGTGDLQGALIALAQTLAGLTTKEVPEFSEAIGEMFQTIRNPKGNFKQVRAEFEELKKVYEDINENRTFDLDYTTDLINRYPELAKAVKIVGEEYQFEEEALIDLINARGENINTIASYEISATKDVLEYTRKRIRAYETEYMSLKASTQALSSPIKDGFSKPTEIAFGAEYLADPDYQFLIKQREQLEAELKELEDGIKEGFDFSSSISKDSTKETFDWYGTAVERLEQEISDLDHIIDDDNATLEERNKAIQDQIGYYEELNKVLTNAEDAYLEKANAVGLDDKYVKLIEKGYRLKDGSLGIETITDEEDIKDIEEYTKWYKLALDANSSKLENNKAIADLWATLNEKPDTSLFDGIEIKLKNLEERIKEFDEVISDTSLDYDERKSALNDKFDLITNEQIDALERAKEEYQKLADAVDLDEDLKALVREGDFKIDPNVDEDTSELIDEYQKWLDKIEETDTALDEARKNAQEYYRTMFDLTESEANDKADDLKQEIEELNQTLEESAYTGEDTTTVYNSIISTQTELATSYHDSAIKLRELVEQMVAMGLLKPNSQEWQQFMSTIENFANLADNSKLEVKDTMEESYQAIVEKYDRILSDLEHQSNITESQLAQSEAQGYIDTTKHHYELLEQAQERLNTNVNKQKDLKEKIDDLLSQGYGNIDTESLHNLQEEYNSTTEAIEESKLSILEIDNQIRQVGWDIFDFGQKQIARITDEAEFLIDLMDEKDKYDEKGQLTDIGLAVMGQHGLSYNVYIKQAKDYAKELQKIEEDIAKNPADTALIERKNELLDLYQDSILAAKEQKYAIIDMLKEGINLELESLQKVIDAYNENLDQLKEQYDWQRKTASQVKNIAKLNKILASYEGDTSEESRAKIQQIRVQLEEAQADLEDSQYDHYISEQKDLLTSLYSTYEEVLNQRLDNVDALFEEMMDKVDANADIIADTIAEETTKVGYAVTDEMENIWDMTQDTIQGSVGNVIGSLDTELGELETTIKDKLDEVIGEITNKNETESQEQETLQSVVVTLSGNLDTYFQTIQTNWSTLFDVLNRIDAHLDSIKLDNNDSNTNDNTSDIVPTIPDTSNSDASPTLSVGSSFTDVTGEWHHTSEGGATGAVDILGADNWKIDKINEGSTYPYHIIGYKGNKFAGSGWVDESAFPEYSTGLEKATSEHLAWTQDGGDEVIIRPSDGAILTKVYPNDMILNSGTTARFWEAMNNPSRFVQEHMQKAQMPDFSAVKGGNMNNVENHFDFNITGVTNLDDLAREIKLNLQHDHKFEKMIEDMSINKLAGGSRMAKYSYNFK